MMTRSRWRIIQQFVGVAIIVGCVGKFVDNVGRQSNEFLYYIRSGPIERWQEQIALVAIIASTAGFMIFLSRSRHIPD
jgi:hypothetical protein